MVDGSGVRDYKHDMTLNDAEKIVQEYRSTLARERLNDGPASYASWLAHSPETIIQAMKLWLAREIQSGSLTEELRNLVGSAASRIPYFIEDEEARRLNTIQSDFSPAKRAGLSPEEFMTRSLALVEVHDWTGTAMFAGTSLRGELSDFIATVEEFDPSDHLYWQRVYTLAGIEYSVAKKRSIRAWFSSRTTSHI
jgi:hypothetical protein